jgi:hypothetical protein
MALEIEALWQQPGFASNERQRAGVLRRHGPLYSYRMGDALFEDGADW